MEQGHSNSSFVSPYAYAKKKSSYEDQFLCSVCLDVLKKPVTNYCMSCINDVWSGLDQNAVYSCPECRETFSPRPALKKNTLLVEVMEMMNASDQAATSDQINLSCVKVECDFCIGTKNKAEMFCLQCLASFCELHLQPHYESPAFTKHKLVTASAQAQKNICSDHGKLLDMYCCDDQQCICYLCMVESHKDHKTSSVESERIKHQETLERTKIHCQQMIDQKAEDLSEINRAVRSIMDFVKATEEDGERMFTELISSIKRRWKEVKTLISAQEKTELSRAEEVRQRLDRELAKLRAKMTEIDQLSATHDHIEFIRKQNLFHFLPLFEDLPSIRCQHREFSENISMSALKEHINDVCRQEVARIAREGLHISKKTIFFRIKNKHKAVSSASQSKTIMNIHALEPPEPETRKDFLRYFCELHMDPNTVHKNLHLSEGDRKVTRALEDQPYPDHPERFDGFPYVLCKEDLYGRCYWEADCRGDDWTMAMSYKRILRKGVSEVCRFGFNTLSWRLSLKQVNYFFKHNKNTTRIRQADLTTIGVYLDHSAGILSFYSVSDQMTLLHKVQATFTEPLHAGFRPGPGSVIRILQLNEGNE